MSVAATQSAVEQERRRIGAAAAQQWLLAYRVQRSMPVNSEPWWRYRYQMDALAHVASGVCGLGTPDPDPRTGESDVDDEQRASEYVSLPELADDRDLLTLRRRFGRQTADDALLLDAQAADDEDYA